MEVKMKKIVMLLVMIFLVTGCAVKYNVVINEDLTLTEEAKLTGTSDFFDIYYKTTKKNVLLSMVDIYKDVLDDNNYQYELVDEEIPYVTVTKTYNSVNDYVKDSILFNDYFDEVKYIENGNIKKIETVGYNGNDIDNPDRFDVKELEISIKCPYKVTNHNAKEVNKQTNTYYYELNDENNKIMIEYDTTSKFNPDNELITMIIVCIIIIIVSWIIAIVFVKKNKNK